MKAWRRLPGGRDRWLLGGAAVALAATFADPRPALQRRLFEHVVVVDVSQSMNVRDAEVDGRPVSRLEATRTALRGALLALPCGSKVGWGVFTEYRSYLLLAPVEVCANLDELRSTLAAIDGRMAWVGGSEVAKGVHSGLAVAKQLPGVPSLVFVTDGQEAPPLSARHRPAYAGQPGEVRGLIVGVGGSVPAPIPKTDLEGRPIGVWSADDVQQTDPRSQGRGASVRGETMADDASVAAPVAIGATPGSEHLSALREAYLRLLAGELGLGFHRLDGAPALAAALTADALARPVRAPTDLRGALAALAFALLLGREILRLANKRNKAPAAAKQR